MVNRVIVGAHYGLRDWLMQRITAIIMAVYTIIMAVVLLSGAPSGHAAWRALFSQGWIRVATFLFVVSLALHAWVGMRDIWMDYVKPTGVRLFLQVMTILWLVGCAGWAVQILWRT